MNIFAVPILFCAIFASIILTITAILDLIQDEGIFNFKNKKEFLLWFLPGVNLIMGLIVLVKNFIQKFRDL